MATQHVERNLLLNLYREENISLVCFFLPLKREKNVWQLQPPFSTWRPLALLPVTLSLIHGLFSSCGEEGYSLLQRTSFSLRLISCCGAPALGDVGVRTGAWQLQLPGSRAQALLCCMGLVAQQQVGPPRTWDQSPYLLHWQVGSLPLSHQGSPGAILYAKIDLVQGCQYSKEIKYSRPISGF